MIILPCNENLDKKRIAAIYEGMQHTISVIEAATILKMPRRDAAKLLARWTKKHWLVRIKRGLYLRPSIEPSGSGIIFADTWIIAEKSYNPCYIGAWSAAKHWGLITQESNTVMVFTIKKIRDHSPVIQGAHFSLRTVAQETLFGLLPIRRGGADVIISDSSRTIIDFLVDPQLGGGINSVIDIFVTYLKSEHKNVELLYDYAKRLCNGAVLKRLGFLLEQFEPVEGNIIAFCKILMTSGNVKLDPKHSADKLITRWNLWISNEAIQMIENKRHF